MFVFCFIYCAFVPEKNVYLCMCTLHKAHTQHFLCIIDCLSITRKIITFMLRLYHILSLIWAYYKVPEELSSL